MRIKKEKIGKSENLRDRKVSESTTRDKSVFSYFIVGMFLISMTPYLILIALIVGILLFLIVLKLINDDQKDDLDRKINPPPLPPDEPSKKEVRVEKFNSIGEPLDKVVKGLNIEYPKAKSIGLKKANMTDGRLVGVFFIQEKNKILKYREIDYKFVSRREIEKDKRDICDRKESWKVDFKDKNYDEVSTTPMLYVDEYRRVYLKEEKRYRVISTPSIDENRKNKILKAKKWINLNCGVDLDKLGVKNTFHKGGYYQFLIEEDNQVSDHYFMIDDTGVEDYKKIEKESLSLYRDKTLKHNRLPFTHGIEIELQVVRKDWRWLEGSQMSIIFEEILDDARKKISELKNSAKKFIQRKWKDDVFIQEDDRGYEAVHIKYSVDNNDRYYSILGKDSHVTFETNILEIQTPPCEYLEELEWWAYHLYRIIKEVVRDLKIDADVIPVGTNPVEKYSEGLSFGEHHHLGIKNNELKTEIYNIYRELIPHLIAISSNSPFIDGKKPDYTFNDWGNLVITHPSPNMRLKRNKEQFKAPPPLPSSGSDGKHYLEQKLGRRDESLRMIDVYPFTRYDTIEIRVFDTQITTLDRISLAIILQAIALYTKDKFEKGKKISKSSSPLPTDVLKKNRQNSIEDGLLGRVCVGEERTECLRSLADRGSKYIYEDWQNILKNLIPYFEEMGLIDTPFLNNIFFRVFSLKKDDDLPLAPPISPSQLILYKKEASDFESFLKTLRSLSVEAAQNKRSDLWFESIDIGDIKITDFEGL